jgi:hypothetical protein
LCDAQHLQRLAGHQQLQQLLLQYDDSCKAHAAAAAWLQLPQLCSLSISRERPSLALTPQESARVSVQGLRFCHTRFRCSQTAVPRFAANTVSRHLVVPRFRCY